MKKGTLLLFIVFWTVYLIALSKDLFKEQKTVVEDITQQTYEVQSEIIMGEIPIINYEKIKENLIMDNAFSDFKDLSLIKDEQEWFIAYKDVIEKYSEILDPPETIYDYFTEEELYLLFHVVQAEIGDEYSFKQKVNVASVIFNRLNHERFPDNIGEILIASQFSVISSGKYENINVSETTILACEYAFSIEDTTNGCLFFDSNNTLNYKFVFNDGVHNFYTLQEEYNAQEKD